MRITYYLNINDKFNNYSQFFEEKQYKHIKGVHFIQNLSLSNKHNTSYNKFNDIDYYEKYKITVLHQKKQKIFQAG